MFSDEGRSSVRKEGFAVGHCVAREIVRAVAEGGVSADGQIAPAVSV